MLRKTEAMIFIQILGELLDQERKRRKARLRLQMKPRVRRFVKEFRTGMNGSSRVSDWTPKGRRAAREAARQIPVD